MASGGRPCRVCHHPDRAAIDQAILNGKPFRAIARDFVLGSDRSGEFRPDHKIVSGHVNRCMPDQYQSAMTESKTAHGAAIAARLRFLDEQVDLTIKDAKAGQIVMVGDTPMLDDDGAPVRERSVSHLRTLLAAVREGRHNAALLAKLAGALPEEDQDALEAARAALANPDARKALQQVEEILARAEAAAGQDKVE